MSAFDAAEGTLDGLTLARFAHGFLNEDAGGIERYLTDLNAKLLERSRMTIVQVYLTENPERAAAETLYFSKGKLIMVPARYERRPATGRLQRRGSNSRVCHDLFLATLNAHKVDLAVFHWVSRDSPRVVKYFAERRVPYVLVNHFHNKRFWKWLLRREFIGARAVAGVSGMDLPWFIKRRFANVSDGINTDFFRVLMARNTVPKRAGGMIILVARVTEGKGHWDALQALGALLRSGLKPTLAFVGKVDSPVLEKQLRDEAVRAGLEGRVLFLGQLTPEALREWYAAGDVVILPSQSEGLGRVLLEAQAMEKPVVAYSAGGTREAIKDGETGFLVPAGDLHGLATKVRFLLEDRTSAQVIGRRGRMFVAEQFSLSALAERHEHFYLSALHRQ